jgi:catechol 2,3-dioxygenase-like lactoylglutathione lyase family enzyme
LKIPAERRGGISAWGAVLNDQASRQRGDSSRAFYFLDPDGNRIEIYCWMMKVTRPTMAAPHPDP